MTIYIILYLSYCLSLVYLPYIGSNYTMMNIEFAVGDVSKQLKWVDMKSVKSEIEMQVSP